MTDFEGNSGWKARRRAASALAGIKVVELGGMVSAPYCARMFADFGADVIKVEPPMGEIARRAGPFPEDVPHLEKSGLFFIMNTNKRGVTCDVSIGEGRELFLRLIAQADMLIENHTPAQMRAWALDYAELARINPNLVMVSITPYGQTGPYSNWNGCDLNAYHLSGASMRYCGRPNEMPLQHGTFSADYFGAVTGATWGLAALHGRELIGGGQQLDVSSAEAIAATYVGGPNIGGYAQDGVFNTRTGMGNVLSAPAGIVSCRDGQAWFMVMEGPQWNGLRKAMGDPEWAQMEMLEETFVRGQNGDIVYAGLTEWTMQHDKFEVMEMGQAAGVPVSAVLTIAEATALPHLRERGYFVEIDHAVLGRVRLLGAPFKLPSTPGGPCFAAPLLGEHNDEVWRGMLGLSADELARLREQGIV